MSVADSGRGSHGVLDVAPDAGHRLSTVCLVPGRGVFGDQIGQRRASGAVVDGDERLQIGASRVKPPTVEHRRHRQRRRAGVVDDTAGTAAIDAMPAAPGGHPVHHVYGPQHDVVPRQLRGERRAQGAVLLVAHRAARSVGVDDHRDGRLGAGGRGDLREMPDLVSERVGEIDPHHRPQFATVDR